MEEDESDLRILEKHHEEENKRLQAALRASGVGVWEWNVHNNRFVWDRQSQELFGVVKEFSPKNYDEFLRLVYAEDRDRVSREVLASVEEGDEFKTEFRVLTKEGIISHISLQAALVVDERKNLKKLSGVCFDVTERARAWGTLNKAKESAENVLRQKSNFIARVSHEIRMPMNGVLGMTTLLLLEPLSERVREMIQVIRNSAERLLNLINDILDFSRLELTSLDLEKEPFNVASVVPDTVNILNPKALEKDLELTCEIDAKEPIWLIGDTTRYSQVVMNLVGNAIKFTEKGFVKVLISFEEKKGGEVEVLTQVKDSGKGISKEDMKNLFEDFSRNNDAETKKQEGAGLGLSISKQLCEVMGGEIWVESVVGEGSTFSFTVRLPKHLSDDPLEEAMESKDFFDEGLAERLPLEILLTEDNKINQVIAAAFLKRFGYEVDLACNGQEAVEAVQNRDYDVVFMDAKMPVMDGVEATQKIKELFPVDPPRIVAMTANAMDEDREYYLSVGMDDFVSKPISPESLFEVLLACKKEEKEQELSIAAQQEEKFLVLKDSKIGRLNLALLFEDFYDSHAILRDIIDKFLEEGPGLVDEMYKNLREQDVDSLYHNAGTLRSIVQYYRISELVSYIEKVEAIERGESFAFAKAKLDRVRELSVELEESLRVAKGSLN